MFTNGSLLVYSITVIPMFIHYLYKPQTQNQSVVVENYSVNALSIATFLRCLLSEYGDDECEWKYLSKDYVFVAR